MYSIRIYIILMILAMPFCSIAKEPVDLLFARANKEYTAKNYEAAVSSYQKVLDAGVKTAAVYYNLGNAHYRLNSFAPAILNYERAQRLSPNDKDINANLALVNSKITDKMDLVPELFLKRWWTSFLLLLSVQSWSVAGSLALLIGFGGLIVYLFSKDIAKKRLSFFIGLTLIFLGICFVSFANAQDGYLQAQKDAVVFTGALHVKSAPDVKQKTLMVIHEGTKVKVLEQKADWFKVELPNGNLGWVEAAALKMI